MGKTWIQGVLERNSEENIRTYERGS